jgi:hypothetical protein
MLNPKSVTPNVTIANIEMIKLSLVDLVNVLGIWFHLLLLLSWLKVFKHRCLIIKGFQCKIGVETLKYKNDFPKKWE